MFINCKRLGTENVSCLNSSFGNVKTLHVGDGIVKDISRCLQSDDGELPLELLPELQSLRIPGAVIQVTRSPHSSMPAKVPASQ